MRRGTRPLEKHVTREGRDRGPTTNPDMVVISDIPELRSRTLRQAGLARPWTISSADLQKFSAAASLARKSAVNPGFAAITLSASPSIALESLTWAHPRRIRWLLDVLRSAIHFRRIHRAIFELILPRLYRHQFPVYGVRDQTEGLPRLLPWADIWAARLLITSSRRPSDISRETSPATPAQRTGPSGRVAGELPASPGGGACTQGIRRSLVARAKSWDAGPHLPARRPWGEGRSGLR